MIAIPAAGWISRWPAGGGRAHVLKRLMRQVRARLRVDRSGGLYGDSLRIGGGLSPAGYRLASGPHVGDGIHGETAIRGNSADVATALPVEPDNRLISRALMSLGSPPGEHLRRHPRRKFIPTHNPSGPNARFRIGQPANSRAAWMPWMKVKVGRYCYIRYTPSLHVLLVFHLRHPRQKKEEATLRAVSGFKRDTEESPAGMGASDVAPDHPRRLGCIRGQLPPTIGPKPVRDHEG